MFDLRRKCWADQAFPDLRARFPAQFESCLPGMVAIEPGWIEILERLLERIESTGAVKHLRFSWVSIQEKYGELRAEWTFDTSIPRAALERHLGPVSAVIDSAELESTWTCQICSLPATNDEYLGWHMTLCAAHGALRRAVENA